MCWVEFQGSLTKSRRGRVALIQSEMNECRKRRKRKREKRGLVHRIMGRVMPCNSQRVIRTIRKTERRKLNLTGFIREPGLF